MNWIQNAISLQLIGTGTVVIPIHINVVSKQLSQLSFIQQILGSLILLKLIVKLVAKYHNKFVNHELGKRVINSYKTNVAVDRFKIA